MSGEYGTRMRSGIKRGDDVPDISRRGKKKERERERGNRQLLSI